MIRMKFCFLLLMGLVGFLVAGAQPAVPIKLVNQYEGSIGSFTLTGAGTEKAYTADKEGNALIQIDTTAEYLVTAGAHDTVRFVYSQLP
ncbi:MAG: hypothetical protein QM664_06335, partial [Flavihumibacter sp.]